MDITVCIPTIASRPQMLSRAVASAMRQNKPPAAMSIAVDTEHLGAWHTRTRAVQGVQTEWIALLDDDDQLYPDHLEVLAAAAQETGADYVYSWFDAPMDFLAGEFEQWQPGYQTTTTVLVRTEFAQLGWPQPVDEANIQCAGEDYQWTARCVAAGAKLHHVVGKRTWSYNWHGANTSGLGHRW